MQQSYVQQQQLHKKNNPKENEVHMIERWFFLTARILPRECRVCSNTVALVDDPNTRFEECAEQINSPAICCLPGCLPARKENLHSLSFALFYTNPQWFLGALLERRKRRIELKIRKNVWRKKNLSVLIPSRNWKISRVWFAGLVCMLQQMKPLFFFFFLSIVLLQTQKIFPICFSLLIPILKKTKKPLISSSSCWLFCCSQRSFSKAASLFWFLSWKKQRKTSHLLLSCLHDRLPTANRNTQSTTETGVKMMTSHKSKTKKMSERESGVL